MRCAAPHRKGRSDEIVGSGVMLIEVVPSPEDSEPGVEEDPYYFVGVGGELPTGQRYVAYHLTCFESVVKEAGRQESMVIANLIVGPVSELDNVILESEGMAE
jgi:hypothetical protein